jgi:transcriptional regulator with XRE-family HTH domain
MNLGSAVKLIRTARKIRQRDLAERIKVSPNYLSMLEAGRRTPSLDVLRLLAKELDVPAGLFLMWDESGRPPLRDTKLRKVRELLVRIQAIYLGTEEDELVA